MRNLYGTVAFSLGLILSMVSLYIIIFIPFGAYVMYGLSAFIIIMGIIGFKKDESRILAVLGIVFGIIHLGLTIVFTQI
jgi:hypothetical protein